MPPRKRPNTSIGKSSKKRLSATERERLICKNKLDALEAEESQSKEDRFSLEERRILLDAYDADGFKVFQDVKLLCQYLPNRRETDLKGLVQRLRQSLVSDDSKQQQNNLDDWQKTCQQLMNKYARDRKTNINHVIADALVLEADESVSQEPHYSSLLRNFSELLKGTFPNHISPINAQISMKLFAHLNTFVDSLDLTPLKDGLWLERANWHKTQHSLALDGLNLIRECPTLRDLETNNAIEALCLELPKIRRISNILDPLQFNSLKHPFNPLEYYIS